MAPRMAPITNSKTHPRIVVTDKCYIVCNRSWSAKTPSGCRTHPRSQPPGIFSSGVGVDVPVVQFGRGRAPSGDDGHVAVDVDDHLVDLDGWKRIVPQVLDVSLLGPHLPVAPSRYEKDGERFGWLELPGTAAEGLDEPQVQLRQGSDVVHDGPPVGVGTWRPRRQDRSRPRSAAVRLGPASPPTVPPASGRDARSARPFEPDLFRAPVARGHRPHDRGDHVRSGLRERSTVEPKHGVLGTSDPLGHEWAGGSAER